MYSFSLNAYKTAAVSAVKKSKGNTLHICFGLMDYSSVKWATY